APFEVAKDTFRPDSDLFNQVRDWWVGLDPMVRKAVEEGNLVLRIAGRASATGTDQFNLDLSDKRAKRVGRIIEGLAGSDARLRIFFTGEMFAPQGPPPPELASERRVDVDIKGDVPGPDAKNMTGDPCAGHTDTLDIPGGGTVPVDDLAEPAQVGDAPSATTPSLGNASDDGSELATSGAAQPTEEPAAVETTAGASEFEVAEPATPTTSEPVGPSGFGELSSEAGSTGGGSESAGEEEEASFF